MSLRASSWVLGHTDTEGGLRLVLLVLACIGDAEGAGRMRPGKLAQLATIPPDTVEKALRLLDGKGKIAYEGLKSRRGHSNTFGYRVLVPEDYRPELKGDA